VKVFQSPSLIKNEVVFIGKTRKIKSALLKTINRLFPGVVITEKPYSPSKK
jgi:hypothetical protein